MEIYIKLGLKLLGLMLLTIVSGIALSFYYSWAFIKCWDLLAAPQGWELPFTLTQIVIIGFLYKVFYIFNQLVEVEKPEDTNPTMVEKKMKIFKRIMTPLMAIALAYIFSLILNIFN